MSTKVVNGDGAAMAAAEVEFATCECCGLKEECTPAYIARVRERHGGRWICGLCTEAVKDEICRAGRRISAEEAVHRHASFCEAFRSPPPTAAVSAEHLIAAMRQLFRRSLDCPRALRSTPSSPLRKDDGVAPPGLTRSGSCFSTLAG